MQERPPSRRKAGAALITATMVVLAVSAAASLLISSSSSFDGSSNNHRRRRLWSQNIFWSGDPTRVPPPPPPKQPKPPKANPPPPAPRLPAKGNPFENVGHLSSGGGDDGGGSSSSNVMEPKPSPPPPVPTPNPPADSSGAISSASYYSRPSGQASIPDEWAVEESAVAESEEETQTDQAFEFDGTFSIGPPKPKEEEVIAQTFSQSAVEQDTSIPAAVVQEEPSSVPQTASPAAAVSQTTTVITSSLELSGVPSDIPPAGSMERMALLNLLVHRVESELSAATSSSSLENTNTVLVKEITILAIGDTDVTTRRGLRRGAVNKALTNEDNDDDNNNTVIRVEDRSLWSSTQAVKFRAVLEYTCSEEDQESCGNAAQTAADDLVDRLSHAPSESTSDAVDNRGENWSNIGKPSASQFLWLPDGTSTDVEVITERPTSEPSSHPSSSPTSVPTALPTSASPTASPTSSPMQIMQSYSVDIQIDTTIQTSQPTSRPTSSKPTSPSAITENEWFTTAGLFQGDAAKRFCGYDWTDVVEHCL